MFLTIHSTAGIALAMLTGNPLIAFIVSFFSHFILDIIPHGDEFIDYWTKAGNRLRKLTIIFSVDFLLSLLFIGIVFRNLLLENPYLIIAGIAGGIAPDFLSGFTIIFKHKLWNWYNVFHKKNHMLLQSPIPFRYGIMLQLITLALLTYQILF